MIRIAGITVIAVSAIHVSMMTSRYPAAIIMVKEPTVKASGCKGLVAVSESDDIADSIRPAGLARCQPSGSAAIASATTVRWRAPTAATAVPWIARRIAISTALTKPMPTNTAPANSTALPASWVCSPHQPWMGSAFDRRNHHLVDDESQHGAKQHREHAEDASGRRWTRKSAPGRSAARGR